MRAIADGTATSETLEMLNYTTAGSLIKQREYVTFDARGNPIFTKQGHAAYVTYQELEVPKRSHPGAVPEYVALMLGFKQARKERAAS